MSETKKFERFGKYLILDHLVDGGMAKICRARYLGEQANKIVAIKMVQPQFTKDPAFVQMFQDELKVTFGLLHPNIAQMYDYGIVNNQLFTAMEYVDGANLKQYLDRLKERKCVFPEEISVYIISQVCQALHYAHTFTDKLTGKPFNIIHRDISPHNIMLTYDGAVKVIDFGIAKADSNSEATQAGTIKGKLSYLAPEYLDGLELDPRYDEFAVGITLWEMLTGRKLFTASNDLAVLKQIQACKIPKPSKFNPHVPKELDDIVLKSLSKDRNQRYEDMDKFNRALVKFLYANYPDFNPTDLNAFAEQLFDKEISLDKKKFVEYGKIDIKPYLIELQKDSQGNKSSSSDAGGSDGPALSLGEGGRTRKIELDFKIGDEAESQEIALDFSKSAQPEKTVNKRVAPSQSGPKKVSTASGAARRSTSGTAVRRTKTAGATQSRTRVVNKGKAEKKSGTPASYVAVASVLVAGFLYMQADLIKDLVGLNKKPVDQKEVITERVNRVIAEQAQTGTVTFKNYDYEMTIYVNGQKANMNGIEVSAPLYKKLHIEVRKNGHKKYVNTDVRLTPENPQAQIQIPNLEVERIGLLSTSRNFASGSKLVFDVDGEKIEQDLPIDNYRVPAGVYEGVIANPLLGTEKKVKFVIQENKKVFLE
jgi:eukaryotic-like serine/threonine-protein kinase